jgi:acetaldehyde dehydrogenase (acetylating)
MTLGCGGFGGNITSDNISPRHLLNIKRLAYELRPVTRAAAIGAAGLPAVARQESMGRAEAGARNEVPLPRAPVKPEPEPIPADELTRRIDAFLAARGIAGGSPSGAPEARVSSPSPRSGSGEQRRDLVEAPSQPAQFVCEEDVRSAVKAGQKILVGEKTIITPAARDAGEAAKIFMWQSYPL